MQTVADRYAAFVNRDAVIVSGFPKLADRMAEWQSASDPPYPLLADPRATVGDAFGQTVQFGFLGNVSDFIDRQPEAGIIDCRGHEPTIAWSHAGRSTFDRPTVDDLLAEVDPIRA